MPNCCAKGCVNRSQRGAKFHRFPRDPERRKIWEAKVHRKTWKANDHSCLCTEHFDQSQYEQRRLDGKKRLRPDAVPTIFSHKKYKIRTRRTLGLATPNSEIKEGGSKSEKTILKEHSYSAAPSENRGSSSCENGQAGNEAQQTILLRDINVRRSWAQQKELFLKRSGVIFSKDNARTDDAFVSHLLALHAKKYVALPSSVGYTPTRPTENTNTRLYPSGVHILVQGADKADVLQTSRLLSMKIAGQTLNPSAQSNVPISAENVLPDSTSLTTMEVLPETSRGVMNIDTSTNPNGTPGDCTLQNNTTEDGEVSKSRISQDGGTTSKCDICQKMYQRDKLNFFFNSQQERCLVKCDVCIFSEGHGGVSQDDLGMMSACVDLASEPGKTEASYRPNHRPQSVNPNKGKECFKCKVCFKVLTARKRLIVHMRTHRKCIICSKTFNHLGHFITHMRTHTGEKPFACKLCPKVFKSGTGLSTHVRTHTGEKAYKCDTCGKAFTRRTSYTRHIQIHTGKKPFQCTTCPKAFFQKSCLKTHLATHTKEKSFKCNLCEEAFTSKALLGAHMTAHRKLKSLQSK